MQMLALATLNRTVVCWRPVLSQLSVKQRMLRSVPIGHFFPNTLSGQLLQILSSDARTLVITLGRSPPACVLLVRTVFLAGAELRNVHFETLLVVSTTGGSTNVESSLSARQWTSSLSNTACSPPPRACRFPLVPRHSAWAERHPVPSLKKRTVKDGVAAHLVEKIS